LPAVDERVDPLLDDLARDEADLLPPLADFEVPLLERALVLRGLDALPPDFEAVLRDEEDAPELRLLLDRPEPPLLLLREEPELPLSPDHLPPITR
jgi:hypothetical protein